MPTPAITTGIIHIEMLCTPAKSSADWSIGILMPPMTISSPIFVTKASDWNPLPLVP